MDSTSGTQSSLASSKRVNLTAPRRRRQAAYRPLGTPSSSGRRIDHPRQSQVDIPISDTSDRPRLVFQNREIPAFSLVIRGSHHFRFMPHRKRGRSSPV